MARIVLVLGASGHFGGHAVRAFEAAGWEVRRYTRGTDMAAAAKGVDVIVNGLNPPRYHAWARLIPAITRQVIAAGLASGATVIVPGNVYVYGDQPGPWGPDTPHRPVSRKGAIRAEMEASYRAATARGLRVIILRGGDFIDPEDGETLMSMLVLKNLTKGRITALGAPEVRRAYANLPDITRAAVALAEKRADLPAFADIPFAGYCFSVSELKARIEAITGQQLRISRFPWWSMWLAAPVWELARELIEMRYLFETEHALDPEPLAALLPTLGERPLEAVIIAHLPQDLALARQAQAA